MRIRLRTTAALLAALLLCAASAGAADDGREPAAGPDPVVQTWTEWPHRVSCLHGLQFDPVAAFSTSTTNAELGQLPSERALRRVLASDELPRVRRHGWRHLTETSSIAEFAAGRLFTEPRPGSVPELEWIQLEKAGGRWRLAWFTDSCTPRSVRRGEAAATWRLAPEQRLNRDTRRVRIEFEAVNCDGRALPRVQKPEFREQNGHLLMTLWVGPLARLVSTFLPNCPPSGPHLIKLPEKLGSRRLFDGGTYPPLLGDPPVSGAGQAASRSAFLRQ
ncbi:MAG: hypothetical protein WBL45_03870 [Solirubrobacterales bacterium]